MTEERRYDEEEIARILDLAAEATAGDSSREREGGLTLPELQEIGLEVGIQPARIADAAKAVDRRGKSPTELSVLGIPRTASKIVSIPRPLTEDEWTHLVVDLRETFRAKGVIESYGPLKSWTNGNLQVHVEPDGDGYRVRMSTLKGDAFATAASAVTFSIIGLILFVVLVLTGQTATMPLVLAGLISAIGLGQVAHLSGTLSKWSATRSEQMDNLAERIPLLLKE